MEKAIGGYFELEMRIGEDYHSDAIQLNTARNAFEYILLAKRYEMVYLPYFICDVLLEPLTRNGVKYQWYNIDINFEPVFDYETIKEGEAFLYVNYFGLKDNYVGKLKSICRNLIIDNAQSFYSKPEPGIDTFYSPRKFFGLPDGACLYTDIYLDRELVQDKSYDRFNHLLERIDVSAEIGYDSFVANERSLGNNSLKKMSSLTRNILLSIDYEYAALKRKENFAYLYRALKDINILNFDMNTIHVPMVYPFWSNDITLKKRMAENRIYTATYWQNVPDRVNDENALEAKMVDHIIYIPIDQRYSHSDLARILKLINI